MVWYDLGHIMLFSCEKKWIGVMHLGLTFKCLANWEGMMMVCPHSSSHPAFCSGSCAVFWRCQLAPFPDNQTEQLWKSMNGTDVSAGGLIVKAVDRLLTSSSATLQVCVTVDMINIALPVFTL